MWDGQTEPGSGSGEKDLTLSPFPRCMDSALNMIGSSIPSDYGKLTSLQFLEVDRNRLEGTSKSIPFFFVLSCYYGKTKF